MLGSSSRAARCAVVIVCCLQLSAGCSVQTLEEEGLVIPRPKSSEHMRVASALFIIDMVERNVSLMVAVDVRSVPDGARFLRVRFPQTDPDSPPERLTLTLDGSREYEAQSRPLSGLRDLNAYPVLVQLTADEAGTMVLDELTQHVRFQMPPIDEIPR